MGTAFPCRLPQILQKALSLLQKALSWGPKQFIRMSATMLLDTFTLWAS